MLETIREFGLERLAASGEEDATRGRHAAWCLAFAERLAPSVARRTRIVGSALDGELTICARRSAGSRNARGRIGAAPGLCPRTSLVDPQPPGRGRRWLDRALAAGATSGRSRAHALIATGAFRHAVGNYAGAEVVLVEGRRLAEDLGADDLVAYASFHLGMRADFAGDRAGAQTHYEAGLAVARRVAKPFLTGILLENLADCHFHFGDLDRAAALSQEALVVLTSIGDRYRGSSPSPPSPGSITSGATSPAPRGAGRSHWRLRWTSAIPGSSATPSRGSPELPSLPVTRGGLLVCSGRLTPSG